MSIYKRESLYRGEKAVGRLQEPLVSICGLGALGSNLAVNLARCGVSNLRLIDKDRVEESNIGTQAYGLKDIGALKAEALAFHIYDAVGVMVNEHPVELTARNLVKLHKDVDLIIDCFDNSDSRRLISEKFDCLHLGMNGEYGQIQWNEGYRVPGDTGIDDCDNPMARSLITLIVGVATEVIIRYLLHSKQENYEITLQDLKVSRS